jgi:hypothetical protein
MVDTAVFDPYDLDHVVSGAATEGAPGPVPRAELEAGMAEEG